jgi:4-carboxymuconolactone decarboxylase
VRPHDGGRGDGEVVRHEEQLRDLAMNDERFIEDVLAIQPANMDVSGLDPKSHALGCLGALIALDAAPASYQWNVSMAMAAGATVDELVGVLLAVAPIVGIARAVSAASELALAIGYDVDAALEAIDGG